MITPLKILVGALVLPAMLGGCQAKSDNASKAIQHPGVELSNYTPQKDKEGKWWNVEDVLSVSVEPTVEFKKYGSWILSKWFGIVRMRNRASMTMPSDVVLKAVNADSGVNPAIQYNCGAREFRLSLGKAMNSIEGEKENGAYWVYRVDSGKPFAEKAWQLGGRRRLEGVNLATGDIEGKPFGVPESYELGPWKKLADDTSPGLGKFLSARTFEVSIVPNKEDPAGGVYARWSFPRTLKQQKDSGDLDSACKMFLGADYVSVEGGKPE
jgi:hypothetical protein